MLLDPKTHYPDYKKYYTKAKRPVLSFDLFMEDYNSYESLQDRMTHRHGVFFNLIWEKELNANDKKFIDRIGFIMIPKDDLTQEEIDHLRVKDPKRRYHARELIYHFVMSVPYWDDLQFKPQGLNEAEKMGIIDNIPFDEFFIDGHCFFASFIFDWANVKLKFLPDIPENRPKPKRIPDEGDTLSPEDRFLWYMRGFIKKTKIITYEQLAERMVKYTDTKYTESTILNYVKHDLKA